MSNLDESIPQAISVTTATTLPAPVTLTGAVSSVGVRVTGTSTLFLTEIANLDGITLKVKYLWNATTCELREIATVVTNTVLTLKSAFTSDLSSATLKVPDPKKVYREVSIAPAGAGAKFGLANQAAVTMISTVVVNFENESGLTSIALDGTSSAIQVTYQ